ERGELLGCQRVAVLPQLETIGEWPGALQQLLELIVCLFENLLRYSLGPDAVATLDLVGEGDLLAGEPPGDRLEPEQLRVDPPGADRLEAVQRLAERGGVGDEVAGRAQRLGIDGGRDLGRAEVAVDEPVHMPVQAQAELDVSADRVQG